MSSEELILRKAIVCASGVIYWAGVLIQGRRIRKRIGRSPNLKPRGAREKALWVGWFLVIVVWIAQPLLMGERGIKEVWINATTFIFGALLIVSGYAATLWSYAAMGDTWRIGIKKGEKTDLVSNGPYRWIRHPIYFFQIVMLGGAALLLPTVISFGALLTHYVCAVIKARDEEKFLESVHGAAYREHMGRTWGLAPRL